MKKLLTLLLALPLAWGHAAAQENAKYTILLTGASFASPQNGWFEIGCRQLDARALNRAIGGESIADTANRMAEGTLWNAGELDEMDALVIMQVHNRDASATGGLKEKYTDYTTPFDRSNYAAIRRLAARWGLPLVEFDRNIGFSKDTPNPATGTQQSLLHAQDTQTIEGVAYGWHPQRGQDKYIQQRMAAIFTDTMRRILPAK